jgi:hypothetical protein
LVYYGLTFFNLDVPMDAEQLQKLNAVIQRVTAKYGFEVAEGSKVATTLAASYVVIKAAMPLRIAVSMALTPWTARTFVAPISNLMKKAAGRGRAPPAPPTPPSS